MPNRPRLRRADRMPGVWATGAARGPGLPAVHAGGPRECHRPPGMATAATQALPVRPEHAVPGDAPGGAGTGLGDCAAACRSDDRVRDVQCGWQSGHLLPGDAPQQQRTGARVAGVDRQRQAERQNHCSAQWVFNAPFGECTPDSSSCKMWVSIRTPRRWGSPLPGRTRSGWSGRERPIASRPAIRCGYCGMWRARAT